MSTPAPPPRAESYHVPGADWTEPPGLHIRPHFLERQREQQSATGPATDDDEGDRDGRR